jgi:membrane fusion protein (multidrug efflux system)
MAKRMIIMLGIMAAFIAAIGLVKFRQIQVAVAQAAAFQPPPEAVTTAVARAEDWPASLSAIGTVVAVHGVTVSADLPGIVGEIAFESGKRVASGDLLVRLDSRQEEAQLAAAEAQRNLTRLNLDRASGLVEDGVVSRADFDRTAAEFKTAEARVGEIRATIERKTIRAPFAGILGIRQVNRGQYLTGGDPVVPLQMLDPIYVNFSLPQQEVGRVQVDGEVHVTAEGMAGVEFSGKITAIDSVVNEATRMIQVQASFDNPDGKLHPGMFVQTQVLLGSERQVITLPAPAISYAPYGDSVYVVADLEGQNGQSYRGVRQQFVKVGGSRGDLVAVVSGVKPGDEVVTSGVFKLRNGAAVNVDNKIQPTNDPAPKPEDN